VDAETADVMNGPGRPTRTGSGDADWAVTALFRAHHLELVRLAIVMVGDLATADASFSAAGASGGAPARKRPARRPRVCGAVVAAGAVAVPAGAAISVEGAMSFQKKIRNKFQITRGRARQKLGRATGNRRMQAGGLADRIGGNVKQAGQQVKDAGRDLRRGVKR
jgi:uncharacterized protein YjbJ (UPF0337 family)